MVTFGSLFSELLIQFQRELSLSLSSTCSSFSWARVIDLFDGRLFAFTLHQVSLGIRFDSTTMNIIKLSLHALNIPFRENFFSDVLQQIIESKDMIFMASSSEKPSIPNKEVRQQQKITKISNSFIDEYLKPILTSDDQLRIEWIDPNISDAPQYRGRYHWHVFREVNFSL